MKKVVLALMVLSLFAATCWAAQGMAPKGQDVSIAGKLSCTFCNLPAAGGTCSKECCQACIKSGDPALLTDEKGGLYILVSGDHEKPLMTPERMDMVESKVKVTGIVVKRDGIQAIYVKKMEKAK